MIPDKISRKLLLRTHSDYEQVAKECSVLKDTFNGTGGFHPFLETMYSDTTRAYYSLDTRESYLVNFDWETAEEFKERIRYTPYDNLVKQRVVLPIAGYLSKPPARPGYPEPFLSLLDDITKDGKSYDTWLQTDGLETLLVCGFYPTLIVSDSWVGTTEAERLEQGAKPARLVPLSPESILDWSLNSDGDYDWLKYITSYVQNDPLGDVKYFNRVWFITSKEWYYVDYEVTSKGNPKRENDYQVAAGGEWSVAFDAAPAVRRTLAGGSGVIKDIFELIRDGFNMFSEYRHLQRGQNFSLLTFQVVGGESKEEQQAIITGANKALTYTNEVSNRPEYITPGQAPLEDYRKAIKERKESILEVGGTSSLFGQTPATATEAQYRFNNFNNKIINLTKELARDEIKTLELAAKWLGKTFDPTLTPIYPTSFYLKDLEKEVNNAKILMELNYPEEVNNFIRKRLLDLLYSDSYSEELEQLLSNFGKAVTPPPQE